jgi:hypothetical protein
VLVLDTLALLKRYVEEGGTSLVLDLMERERAPRVAGSPRRPEQGCLKHSTSEQAWSDSPDGRIVVSPRLLVARLNTMWISEAV